MLKVLTFFIGVPRSGKNLFLTFFVFSCEEKYYFCFAMFLVDLLELPILSEQIFKIVLPTFSLSVA